MRRRVGAAGRPLSPRVLRLGCLVAAVLSCAAYLQHLNATVHASQRAAAAAAADGVAAALVLKAEAATARCKAAKADTLEKEGERWRQRQLKLEAELKTCVRLFRVSAARGEGGEGCRPTGRERMGSPTMQALQDPILLLPWVCFRGGGFSNPKPG
jgi:hypothetical protein